MKIETKYNTIVMDKLEELVLKSLRTNEEDTIFEITSLIKKLMIVFVESLKNYERESHNLLGFDERETEELLEIFLKHNLKNII
jgi:hypothetical protein